MIIFLKICYQVKKTVIIRIQGKLKHLEWEIYFPHRHTVNTFKYPMLAQFCSSVFAGLLEVNCIPPRTHLKGGLHPIVH